MLTCSALKGARTEHTASQERGVPLEAACFRCDVSADGARDRESTWRDQRLGDDGRPAHAPRGSRCHAASRSGVWVGKAEAEPRRAAHRLRGTRERSVSPCGSWWPIDGSRGRSGGGVVRVAELVRAEVSKSESSETPAERPSRAACWPKPSALQRRSATGLCMGRS